MEKFMPVVTINMANLAWETDKVFVIQLNYNLNQKELLK